MDAVRSAAAPTVTLRLSGARLYAVVLGTVALAAALVFALQPLGGSPAQRLTRGNHAGRALSRLVVPPDSTERQWRASVRSMRGAPAAETTVLALRRHLLRAIHRTGATLVRLRIWRRTSPPASELVIATNLRPAVYLRHRASRLVNADHARPFYLRIVNRHGGLILEWGGAANEGFVGPAGVAGL